MSHNPDTPPAARAHRLPPLSETLSRIILCAALCAWMPSGSSLRAQGMEPPSATAGAQLGRIQGALRDARGRSDWAAYRAAAQRIKELLNASPQSRLESARAEVRAGNASGAMEDLTAYVRMGQASAALETLPDFAPLRQQKAFDTVRASMADNRRVVARSTVAFRVPDAGLLAEDIDFDPSAKRFLISSVLQHRIVATAGEGPLVEVAASPSRWPILGLKIDTKRELIWATEVAIDDFEIVPKADQGRSAVLCFDLKTGRLVKRIEGPRPSALGDIALASDGGIVVSDGDQGGVYRVAPGKDELVRLDRGDFISPQTAAVAADAMRIYVPDYVRGLGVLDLTTKQVRWLPTADRFALDGIDGLYLAGRQLIAVQNGTSPARVVTFSLDSGATHVVAERVIERATATLGDPTHGVVVGDNFYYIANSGWDVLGANGVVKPGTKMSEAVIMKWKLPRR